MVGHQYVLGMRIKNEIMHIKMCVIKDEHRTVITFTREVFIAKRDAAKEASRLWWSLTGLSTSTEVILTVIEHSAVIAPQILLIGACIMCSTKLAESHKGMKELKEIREYIRKEVK